MAEKHKKGYVATLPLLILPGHKSTRSPAKEACSPQEYRQEGTRRVGG